jgi:glucosamine--fructose-6-phosphate aminotransferase (isomerizing)
LHRVYTVGDGDSFHAAMATEMAFENIARIPCEPMSAMRFLEYGADFIPTAFPNDTLVVGISASGSTLRVAQALARAEKVSSNIITAAITGNIEGIVGKAAHRKISVKLPDLGGSPGIRTYAASLMGLYLLAIRIGEIQEQYHQTEANEMRSELISLADVVDATAKAVEKPAKQVAETFKDVPVMVFAGSGPSYGTALFSAAKMVEAAGVFSMGQDLEEWAHVERFAYPSDTPTMIIAPPGRGYWRAAELARTAKELGRRVIAIVKEDDKEVTQFADMVLPVVGNVREEFSPLVYHVFANLFASFVAERLGRMLFQTDNPAILAKMAANMAQRQAGQ